MTKDRIHSLKQVLGRRGEEVDPDSPGIDNVALEVDDENAVYMDHFFKRVIEIREWIDKVNGHVEAIRTLHSQLLSSPRPEPHIKNELEARNETVKELGKKISHNLKDLQKKIDEEERECDNLGAGLRIRKTQYQASMHLYSEAMIGYNRAQHEYRDKCYERIHRVISIAKADITDEKLEELLEKGNYGSIFNGDIIMETMDMQKALEDVQLRHQELLTLEKSIEELRDMFIDMAFLVDKHGELINNIERHVFSASEHVEAGAKQTKVATKYQSKARFKKIIILIIIGVILLAIIIGVVTWTKTGQKKQS